MGKKSKRKNKSSKPEASSINNKNDGNVQPQNFGDLESHIDSGVQDMELSESKILDTTPTNSISSICIQGSTVENTDDLQKSEKCTDKLHPSAESLQSKSKEKSKRRKKRKHKSEDDLNESKRQELLNTVESVNQKSNVPPDDEIIGASNVNFSKLSRESSEKRTQQDNVSSGAKSSKSTTENSFKKQTQHENVRSGTQFSGPSENRSEKRTQPDGGHSSHNVPVRRNRIAKGSSVEHSKPTEGSRSEKRKELEDSSSCKSNTTVNISKTGDKYPNRKEKFSNANYEKGHERRRNIQSQPDWRDTENEYENRTKPSDTYNESWQINRKSQSKRIHKDYDIKSTNRLNSCKESEKKPVKSILQEVRGDLFTVDDEYSLAHCVAEDFRMGAGIAVDFRKKFGGVGELLDQRARTGDVAFLKRGGRYIYYLVTKKRSHLKPTLMTIKNAIRNLQNLCKEHNVKKLAIPLIGCGLDKLDWEDVKDIFEKEFEHTYVSIVAYHYDEAESASSGNTRRPKSLSVRNVSYPLVNIAAHTALVVYGSLDGFANKTCRRLETKYPFIKMYENECEKGKVKLGDFFPILTNCEYVSVFFVKSRASDPFQFNSLEQCIRSFNRFLNKEKYSYVGIEISEDEEDSAVNDKILTVFRHCLSPQVELYVCNDPSPRY